MAFSLRKMLSTITYFKKPGEEASGDAPNPDAAFPGTSQTGEPSDLINFERSEADSTSKHAQSLKLPESIKKFASKKGSLSDTDLLNIDDTISKKQKRRSKKLQLDIKKANRTFGDDLSHSETSDNVENTPKHVLLDGPNEEIYAERFKQFDFNKSFDLFDEMSDDERSSYEDRPDDLESLSDSISLASNEETKSMIKMCRKVDELVYNYKQGESGPSTTPESFGDVEIDKNEEERVMLLLNYQMKIEKIENFLKKLLTEFQFHVEVSKIFNCRSFVSTLPQSEDNYRTSIDDDAYIDNVNRGVSPTGSWNIVMEKEDSFSKLKLKKQLLSMKDFIDEFVSNYLKNGDYKRGKMLSRRQRGITFDLDNGVRVPHKKLRISKKKKNKSFDFPDLSEAMTNLFNSEFDDDSSVSGNNTILNEFEESHKCVCRCHMESPSSQTDSGLTSKSNDNSRSSITSSLGNFSLDNSTLTAYSESLDQIVLSYNSFQDTSLYSTLLQKAAIERITFYIQVHSIQLKCEASNDEFESKNVITFHCPSCQTTETEENGLLNHILSQFHCEKIHFLYKTAYIKKCVQSGKEIQPSTVLNPMKMYRDENKIVCFGDSVYACSLCFENLIVGESILMAHCLEPEHIERKEKLSDIVE